MLCVGQRAGRAAIRNDEAPCTAFSFGHTAGPGKTTAVRRGEEPGRRKGNGVLELTEWNKVWGELCCCRESSQSCQRVKGSREKLWWSREKRGSMSCQRGRGARVELCASRDKCESGTGEGEEPAMLELPEKEESRKKLAGAWKDI